MERGVTDMVLLRKVSLKDGVATYEYRPESWDAPAGVVSVNLETGDRGLIRQSEGDPRRTYAGHAWRRIDRMVKESSFPEEAMEAWY